MKTSELMLPEFDHEMANTRKTLERVPDNKFDWRPHDKSFTLQQLASHLANVPAWTPMTLDQDSIDGSGFTTPQATSTADLLKKFDENVKAARASLAAATDESLQKPWSLLAGGKVLFTMPRGAVLRSFILNHNVHHRAQLTVYLRLNDIPVPALYGPSADETGM